MEKDMQEVIDLVRNVADSLESGNVRHLFVVVVHDDLRVEAGRWLDHEQHPQSLIGAVQLELSCMTTILNESISDASPRPPLKSVS